ncbi:MAG TPA: flippase-like domain-containing protein [Longimicrobiales bacterium]|nr:flippase-like domain-containing protein [Longimicrobiales bacterium]
MDTRHTTASDETLPISRGKMARGLALFVALTVAGLAALWHFTAAADAGQVIAGLSPGFLGLAVIGGVGDILIGAVRYQIFLRRIRPGTSLWLPIRADLANRFVGAVTPSQTGGGPAQVFVLWRGGIPIPDALSFLLVNFLSTLVFFLCAGGFAAWIFRERFPAGGIHLLVQYGFVAFVTALLVMLVGLLRPEWLARPMARAARRLEGRHGVAARLASRCAAALSEGVEQYRAACTRFVRENPWLPVLSLVLTVLLYLNKYTLAWLVMRGLGVDGDYVTTLAVQALLHFILFVAPSPGGSGIAEIGTGALMAILMPAHLLAPFTLAYRFLLIYLPAAAGAVVLLRELAPASAATEPAVARTLGRVPGRARTAGAVTVAMAAAVLTGGPEGAAAALQPARPTGPVGSAETTVAGRSGAADGSGVGVKDLVLRGLRAGHAEEAEALLREAVARARAGVERAPSDAEAHYLLAVALGYHLEHQGLRRKFALAAEVRSEAERALALDPGHAGAHHVMGRLHAGAMRLNRVARLILREVLGASVLEGASWKQAEQHFRQARAADPGCPRHAMELGALYLDTDRPALAREVLAEAARIAPREASDSLAVVRARALLGGLVPE